VSAAANTTTKKMMTYVSGAWKRRFARGATAALFV